MAKTLYWYEYWAKKKSKIDFENTFVKLINNAAFGATMKNVRKHRDIKFVKAEKRRNYLLSEPNLKIIFFSGIMLAIEIIKTLNSMNKPLYLGLSILGLSKIVM